jgi:hypothetical protein
VSDEDLNGTGVGRRRRGQPAAGETDSAAGETQADVEETRAAAGETGSAAGEIGSAAEEAVKLVEALSQWASSRTAAASEHLATGAPECSLCPVCQAIRVLRLARPELVSHLGDAVGSVVAAVRAAVEASERQRAGEPAADGAGVRPAASSRLQHVDIS